MEFLEKTLGQMLEHYAATQPDHDFMVYSDRGLRFTYDEFNRRVDDFAKGLLALGVKKDNKVGIWAKNVPDWLTILFATAKVGGVLVTINTNYKTHELEYLLKDSDIHTLCLVNGYRDSDYVQMVYDLVPELKTTQRGHLRSERFPALRNVVYVGQEKQRGMYTTAELNTIGRYTDRELLDEARANTNCHDVVNIQYTSGTTGFPKGVMLSHYNILNNGLATGDCMAFTPADKVLTTVPLFHCFGCVLSLCAVITHGSTMVMVEDFDPLKVLASVHKERCTALYGVPTMFIAELNHPMFDLFDLSSLRTGIMAGAPCPIETMKQVMEKMYCKDLIIVYGLTETSPGMTATRMTDSPEIRATTVGRAYPGVDVRILDPETHEECPHGTVGEFCCRGYNVMKGYYKKPKETAEVIDKNGFLHSGDLGVMDEQGYFRVTGRIKEMIIRGGENVYPREIENFLYGMPQIEAVEVAGLPSSKYGEQVAAYIRVKKGMTLTEEEVALYCRGQISRYKIPKYVLFVDEYPMTASGKIQKYKLKETGFKILADRGIVVE
ncbi:MAG: AMP-binding protein [Rikenellaceae bacterium]|jgi:fatty-acyl-CoA synthase|nr:AMP-binding protein [Rikenellaceae bacterium]